VIEVGEHNTYGHPHPTTLGFLEKLSGKIHRTDRDGAAQFPLET